MNYIRGRHLPRRTLLKGIGGLAVGLPLLDAMTPAFAQAAKPTPRMMVVYFPNGYIKDKWTPAAVGPDYVLPSSLEPLGPNRGKLTVLTGLCDDPSKTISGFHDRAVCSIFTGFEMSKTGVHVGPSVDQLAAQALGKATQIPSLELATEEPGFFGGPFFASATNRLPLEKNPRSVFERLFGDTDALDPATLEDLRQQRASILDGVAANSADLQRDLGGADRAKLDEYFTAVRDVETRLNIPDHVASQKVDMQRPAGQPRLYVDYVKMMYDLQVIALQTDKTRVISFMMGREASDMEFPEIGWNFSHHLTSHHGGYAPKIEGMTRINRHQVDLFNALLTKIDAIKDGDGTLLDQTMVLYTSSLGDGSRHMQVDLPVIVAGGGKLGLKHGSHVKLPDNTPITNLYLTLLDTVGVRLDKMGDSTGRISAVANV